MVKREKEDCRDCTVHDTVVWRLGQIEDRQNRADSDLKEWREKMEEKLDRVVTHITKTEGQKQGAWFVFARGIASLAAAITISFSILKYLGTLK